MSKEFEKIKNILPLWPEAVDPILICDVNSENEKIARGRVIVDMMIGRKLKGLKFLDFGCGEGYCVSSAEELGADLSVGYDIKDQSWSKKIKEKIKFTTDFEELKKHAPFDVVLIYDVLDHLINDDPICVLQKIGSLINEKTKICCRLHPFVSKHSSHLYNKINKAYIHLILSEEEILSINSEIKNPIPNLKITRPLMQYQDIFTKAGFEGIENDFKSKKLHIENPHSFFKQKIICDRILKNTNFKNFPEWQMSISFIDYFIKKKI